MSRLGSFCDMLCYHKRSLTHQPVWPTYTAPHESESAYIARSWHGKNWLICRFNAIAFIVLKIPSESVNGPLSAWGARGWGSEWASEPVPHTAIYCHVYIVQAGHARGQAHVPNARAIKRVPNGQSYNHEQKLPEVKRSVLADQMLSSHFLSRAPASMTRVISCATIVVLSVCLSWHKTFFWLCAVGKTTEIWNFLTDNFYCHQRPQWQLAWFPFLPTYFYSPLSITWRVPRQRSQSIVYGFKLSFT